MRNRATQIALLVLVGALIAWWLRRDDEVPAPRVPVVKTEVVIPEPEPVPEPSRNPGNAQTARVEFRLPGVPGRRAEPEAAPEPPPPPTFGVPKEWLLRGSASTHYELRSDHATAFSGNYSAVLRSHKKDIAPNLSGSAVQAILASPYVGKRMEFSMALRADVQLAANAAVWAYVTDPARSVIAYQIASMRVERGKGEWNRYRVVIDVPWHGEVLAYGFSLMGKGMLWADDVRLSVVDPSVPLTGSQNNAQLGVIAQAVSLDGALTRPANMDFEDVLQTRDRQEAAPPDTIDATRF